MIDRKPAHKNFVLANFHACDHLADIGHQIGISKNNSFWIPSTPRGILKECYILRLYSWKTGFCILPGTIVNCKNAQPSTCTRVSCGMHLLSRDVCGRNDKPCIAGLCNTQYSPYA